MITKFFEMDKLKENLVAAAKYAIRRSVIDALHRLDDCLSEYIPNAFDKVLLTGWGKAVDPVIEELLRILPPESLTGAVYLSPSPDLFRRSIRRFQADHPYPSKRNIRATEELKRFLTSARQDDLVIAVSTGGGSAMLVDLESPVTLRDAIEAIRLLNNAGVDMRSINAVRRSYSNIKSGQLLQHIPANNIITIVVSDDVLNRGTDRCSTYVASGPTCYMKEIESERKRLLRNLEEFELIHELPPSIRESLRREKQIRMPRKNHVAYVIGDNLDLVNNAKKYLEAQGFVTRIRKDAYYSECECAAEKLYDEFCKSSSDSQRDKPFAYIAGGEVTVRVTGNGVGGRCQQLASHFIDLIRQFSPSIVVAVSSDGQDYVKNVAGAYVTSETFTTCERKRVNFRNLIQANNTWRLHKTLGTLITGFTTFTNLGDMVICARPRVVC